MVYIMRKKHVVFIILAIQGTRLQVNQPGHAVNASINNSPLLGSCSLSKYFGFIYLASETKNIISPTKKLDR